MTYNELMGTLNPTHPLSTASTLRVIIDRPWVVTYRASASMTDAITTQDQRTDAGRRCC